MPANPRTLLDKLWDSHVVMQEPGFPAILYIDLHLIHEVTSPQAFTTLRERGLPVSRPDRTVGTLDHATPTIRLSLDGHVPAATTQITTMQQNCKAFSIRLFGLDDSKRGIVHVMGPELGLTQPGMTIVCGDSHTSTHGAFGTLAFGIGTSEVTHVLATQCLLQEKPRSYEVRIDGVLGHGVTAKDIILALLAKIGTDAGNGHVFEYRGSAIESLSMEARMTICNMSIEGGARAGMIAPHDTTFQYVAGREFAPKGADWDAALARWRDLPTDAGATYDQSVTLDASSIEPMITFGVNPSMGIPISGRIPTLDQVAADQRDSLRDALDYMGHHPGDSLLGKPVDVVFIGSCTNARISDLRLAAQLFKGRKVADGQRVIVVPGSQSVREQAEAEGLAAIFRDAGAEWRESGCSMCIAMNGDVIAPGQLAISTTNRNFKGRQGPGSRTMLASPLTAAAAAVTGKVTDPRTLLSEPITL